MLLLASGERSVEADEWVERCYVVCDHLFLVFTFLIYLGPTGDLGFLYEMIERNIWNSVEFVKLILFGLWVVFVFVFEFFSTVEHLFPHVLADCLSFENIKFLYFLGRFLFHFSELFILFGHQLVGLYIQFYRGPDVVHAVAQEIIKIGLAHLVPLFFVDNILLNNLEIVFGFEFDVFAFVSLTSPFQ